MMRWLAYKVVSWLRLAARYSSIELLGRALYYSGLLFLVGMLRQRFGKKRLIIPMYHRVRDPSAIDETALLDVQVGVPADLFERQLRVFRWFGPLMTLDEAFKHLHDPTGVSQTAIALTFDDGYRDNITHALPVLLRNGVRATLFPVTRTASGGRPLWWDELTDTLSKARTNGQGLSRYLAGVEELVFSPADRLRLGLDLSHRAAAEFLGDRLLELRATRREQLLRSLASRLGVTPEQRAIESRYADWDELRSAAALGFEIGGHTTDHTVLCLEDPMEAQTQIKRCRCLLEEKLASPVRSFAYPNGGHDATVRALTAAAGYRLAVTTQCGVNFATTDPFQLRRMPVHCERPFHLALKLAFYDFVRPK